MSAFSLDRLAALARSHLRRPRLDLPLLVALLLVGSIGLVTLYSAGDKDAGIVLNQGARFLMGGIALIESNFFENARTSCAAPELMAPPPVYMSGRSHCSSSRKKALAFWGERCVCPSDSMRWR